MQTRIEQNKDHTQIMREIQFRSSFKTFTCRLPKTNI